MEVTGIALQTVAAGEDVAFTETAVNGTKCIVHRQGSGIIKLRGITNQCKARFLVSYSGNIQIPTGGTVEAISLAIAVDGEPLQSTKMIVTPAAVENLFNVSAQAYVDVPCGCCSTVAVQNTSTQAIEVQNSNLIAVKAILGTAKKFANCNIYGIEKGNVVIMLNEKYEDDMSLKKAVLEWKIHTKST